MDKFIILDEIIGDVFESPEYQGLSALVKIIKRGCKSQSIKRLARLLFHKIDKIIQEHRLICSNNTERLLYDQMVQGELPFYSQFPALQVKILKRNLRS